jgi:type II secretory pathway pseudopilin PulG
MKSLIAKSAHAKARVASIKERGGVLAVLRTEGGAIDLASIMVGVLVIGIVGGVIAATVFAVIPWSQDQAATQALDSVKSAESVQLAFSTGNGAGQYLDQTALTSATGTSAPDHKALLQASKTIKIVTDGGHYIAASKSATGTVFYITDDGQKASTTVPVVGSLVAPLAADFTG